MFCAACELPVLRLIVAAHVGTPQLLYQDPNDADEQDEVHLGDGEGEAGGGVLVRSRWMFYHSREDMMPKIYT